jgi:hypothetical protein
LAAAAVTAATELATNQLRHAGGGEIVARAIHRAHIGGIEVEARDAGPGLAEPAAALAGNPSAPHGLGVGLAGARRLAHELDIHNRLGEGLVVRARVFASPPPWRVEVGICGKPCQGESVSGDDAGYALLGDRILLGLVDGLGHGPAAREASRAAMEMLAARPEWAVLDILHACDDALVSTRGAAGSFVSVAPDIQVVEHAGIGNIEARLYSGVQRCTLAGQAGTLGARQAGRRFVVDRLGFVDSFLLVVATDGLSRRFDVQDAPLRAQPAISIAGQLLLEFGQDHDDATVMVLKVTQAEAGTAA